jgi:hypothetical protein
VPGRGADRDTPLPLSKDEKDGQDNQSESNHIIPSEFLFQIQDGKSRKDNEGNHFLNRFQLGGGKLTVPDTVGRHLKTVLKKRDQPTNDNDDPQRTGLEFQVPVPSECHKDI